MTASVEAPGAAAAPRLSPRRVFFARELAFRFRRHIVPTKVGSGRMAERIGQNATGRRCIRFREMQRGCIKARVSFDQEYNRISRGEEARRRLELTAGL